MAVWRYEVQTAVNSTILDVFSVDPALSLVVLLKLSVHVVNDWLPSVRTQSDISIHLCFTYITIFFSTYVLQNHIS